MINRNLTTTCHASSSSSASSSAPYPKSPPARTRRSSSSFSSSYRPILPAIPHFSAPRTPPQSPSPYLTPTRTELVRDELAQCEGMDNVIQYDDVRDYFHRVGLPTATSKPRRSTQSHHISSSEPIMPTPMPMEAQASPPASALPPHIGTSPPMKALTPPMPMHREHERHPHLRSSSRSSGYDGHQWHSQPMAGPSIQPMSMPPATDPLLTPRPRPVQDERQDDSGSSSHHHQSSSSSSHIRPRDAHPIASGSNIHTHRSTAFKHSRSSKTHRDPPGAGPSTSTRTRHNSKSDAEGVRLVTVFDARGYEGLELRPDPRFPKMMVVDMIGGEPMVIFDESGNKSGNDARYEGSGVNGGAGTSAMGMGRQRQAGYSGGRGAIGAAEGLYAPGMGNHD